jgi:hypothetical protein
MKKYLFFARISNNTLETSLQSKETTSIFQQQANDYIISNATLLTTTINLYELTSNTMYYFDSDEELTEDNNLVKIMRRLGVRKCDYCNQWIMAQDIHSSEYNSRTYKRMCATCISNANRFTQEVFHYHGSGRYFRYLQLAEEQMTEADFQGVGIEMECDKSGSSIIRNDRISLTERFANANKHGRSSHYVWRAERDSSIRNGVELISNCMSLSYAKAYDWSILTDLMKHLGADDSLDSSGFHIHLSKTIFGDNEKEQALNALKLYYFMSMYEDDFFKISGRSSREAMEYCNFSTKSEIERIKNYILARQSDFFNYFPSGHNRAIISSGKTVEIRIFKSTSDPERIKHTINLIIGLCKHLKDVKWEKIYTFSKTLKDVDKDTLNYWRKRGCFMKTMADEKRGEEAIA